MLPTDLRTLIESKNPEFFQKFPGVLSAVLVRILESLVHVNELQDFFRLHGQKKNREFIEAIFDYLDFSYTCSEKELERIPAQGRLICVANHATGSLDGLILLHLLGRVRQDVRIVVSDLLAGLENLNDLFLLYDQYAPQLQKQNIAAIRQALRAEQAVIFFPAGSVAKLSWQGIRELKWMTGSVSLARKYHIPILPIAIHARNSYLYYITAKIHHHLSTMLLSHEMFKKRSHIIPVTIGNLLPASYFQIPPTEIHAKTQTLQELVTHLT